MSDSPPAPGTLPAAVPTRRRHDGWTPERQHDFIQALAESGCVEAACRRVGMTASGAYRLRARPDAAIFRQAWDIALDYAVRRLSDAAFSRALHGVATPIFYRGEQVGERRRFDERLTMFLLRYRDPTRYGAWLDSYEARRHPDGAGIVLAHALNMLMDAAHGFVDPDSDPTDSDPAEADRPLDEGPARSEHDPAPEYDGPPELKELFQAVRAQARELEEGARRDDPAAEDRRKVLVTRRPRRGPASL